MKKTKKIMAVMVAVVVMSSLFMIGAMASDGTSTFNVVENMSGSFQTMIDDLLSMLFTILPMGMIVFGSSLAIAFGIKWFKKITGKA
jgi:hypothetical protein